jgi:ribosomal protein L34
MIAFMENEDLRLVGETSECRRMNDSIAIPTKRAPARTGGFLVQAATASGRVRREKRPRPSRVYRHLSLI